MGTIDVEEHGRVLVGILENPPHALMDAGMVDALDLLVARAEQDDGVGAVVLTGGHPERFVAHYDVAELLAGARSSPAVGAAAARASLRAVAAARRVPGGDEALARTPLSGLAQIDRFSKLFVRMNRCGAAFIAAINGSAQGGGCELSLACDVRMMAAGDYRIGQPEILLGFPPGGGGTQRLARLLGSSRALNIVLDGGPMTPGEAEEIGLVDVVVIKDELLDAALEEAKRLAGRPKAAVAACKRAIYEGGSLPLADGLRLEAAEFLATVASPDAVRAMEAYVAQLERTGELPLYDSDTIERVVEQGSFLP